jgi:hypothetical protein
MASLDNHGPLVTRSHIPIVVVVALGPKARLASYSLKMPVIGGVKLETEVERLGRVQRSWRVTYQFCGLLAEIAITAENEAEARAKAIHQLRQRGLKVS